MTHFLVVLVLLLVASLMVIKVGTSVSQSQPFRKAGPEADASHLQDHELNAFLLDLAHDLFQAIIIDVAGAVGDQDNVAPELQGFAKTADQLNGDHKCRDGLMVISDRTGGTMRCRLVTVALFRITRFDLVTQRSNIGHQNPFGTLDLAMSRVWKEGKRRRSYWPRGLRTSMCSKASSWLRLCLVTEEGSVKRESESRRRGGRGG